ncbi:bifunctional UDP-N-acetylglucosamine diphosphorylase/glucosamine-1-phosphate N-acetyltransferase GlmU [Dolichospermum sp. UHCC 0684]|jgi:bifunctional UDP-N-acetylglucosamine pyrophosphorylase / glucosamine-1-phosphate N-acetyltransferase|uniref:bifunctional UDP-N-acetylglucosamine diphosphorylase/glucosamine-1-phosphate N-acetyltransferase GlmU n=1 Tax=unclassified Dolichospermum TaxID=2622029 RepID=UPI0014467C92|nr:MULTISPECIES: bifunctional UDP-N-acetylglucosamine diphosphorylase/glucosamine-1-phosphate N-acetyltransferase GlmU [unclassified Dolichospermum]MEA5532136.1 bifunctional UDP-N-acetylglucosamine diphosphorylase/glucosamine-1-phosphate N-acetyltransferase GlmU [Dolichospermum sp. UHCC 0684]MTJ37169.1 bifunctional UDP-N-acetylglucosamine diphosphorylase/glucosamine-1-phosphate N-acetyltransferase GlmU [Dolichospermum sp. UHCC 0260]
MVVVAILAAGKGTRMKSNLPKVLHSLGGKSLVERVIESAEPLLPSRRLVIVGYQSQEVKTAMNAIHGVEFVEQTVQLGTGHAIQQLLPHLEGYTGDLLILNGDVPLLRTETLNNLLQTHQENQNSCTILTAQLSNPQGYGRVFRNSECIVQKIVEDKDCTLTQRENDRVNAGIYCFRWPDLAKFLPQLEANNAQKEYYLTDAVTQVGKVMAVDVEDYQEILGINDRLQLATANDILQRRIKEKWLLAGVTLIDPTSITIDETVELQPDVIIEPQTHLRGKTIIQAGSRIGPGSLIENSELGENVTVLYSVVTDSIIQSQTRIGPYAHLRGHAKVGANCRIGNFVELKNTQLGDRTNVSHLSYLGDTTAGSHVNVGAGTITANYDGVKKHRTIIGDRTKTGSNSVLVAPITLGNDVYIAAGSTVTEDVPDDSLVIARSRQVVKPGWKMKTDS